VGLQFEVRPKPQARKMRGPAKASGPAGLVVHTFATWRPAWRVCSLLTQLTPPRISLYVPEMGKLASSAGSAGITRTLLQVETGSRTTMRRRQKGRFMFNASSSRSMGSLAERSRSMWQIVRVCTAERIPSREAIPGE